jgi:hypothetical protein
VFRGLKTLILIICTHIYCCKFIYFCSKLLNSFYWNTNIKKFVRNLEKCSIKLDLDLNQFSNELFCIQNFLSICDEYWWCSNRPHTICRVHYVPVTRPLIFLDALKVYALFPTTLRNLAYVWRKYEGRNIFSQFGSRYEENNIFLHNLFPNIEITRIFLSEISP